MKAQFIAEFLKQRTTRTNLGLFLGMLSLILLVVLVHGLGLPSDELSGEREQLMVLGRGELLATLFAALLGAISITGEYRHGTIRPTFLAMPRRGRVVAAKVGVSILMGAAFGLAGSVVAVVSGTAALEARGVEIVVGDGDYALLLAGWAAAAALWAAIGVGLGAIIRSQVPALVGISAWILFVEEILMGDVADVAAIAKYGPGAAAAAISGQDPETLVAPAVGLVLLALYAAGASVVGSVATTSRDVNGGV
jgi:ABC-2 type transport system permease protein